MAIGLGEGSELRQPLGISIVGGLFLSQILTLYTTPVVFLYMDRFGTLISNVPAGLVGLGGRVTVGGTEVGTLRRTFADVERGRLVAFVGSNGTVEIAARDGSAAKLLGIGVGAAVRA